MRRREVFQVIVTYAVIGWLVLQVAGLTFEPLGLPEWGIRALIIVTIAGFPAVFYLAWLIDFRSEGIMFDLPLWPKPEEIGKKAPRSSQIFAIMLTTLVCIACFVFGIYLEQQFPKPKQKVQTETSITLPPKTQNSIAVLAFESFDASDDTNYFASGLAEEILIFLSRVKELNVAARTSSFRFKGQNIDIREVSKILNVRHVLEGSVRREGDNIRVSAVLIDGAQGFEIWSKLYQRDLTSIFAIQQEIASSVVSELQIALSLDSQSALDSIVEENIDAYVFYLQAREKLRSSNDVDVLNMAKELFKQAISIDQDYARAYAGLCETTLGLYENSNDISDFSSAEAACEQAQRLDNHLNSEVKIALGRLYRLRGFYQRSLELLNQAIAASPTAVDAYIEFGETALASGGYTAAENALKRAVELKGNYWKAHEALANLYYMTERYELSAQSYDTVSQLTPDSAHGFVSKGAAYWMAGNIQQSLTAYETSLALKPSRQAYTNLGVSYYYTNSFEKAVEMQLKALDLAPNDHRVWGRLAESYRFISGRESDSQDAYKTATTLARKNLEINPEDWLTRARLGIYLVFLNEQKEGVDLIDEAIIDSNRNPEALYFKALYLLQENQLEEASTLLREAVSKDASYQLFIDMDPDIKRIKSLKD